MMRGDDADGAEEDEDILLWSRSTMLDDQHRRWPPPSGPYRKHLCSVVVQHCSVLCAVDISRCKGLERTHTVCRHRTSLTDRNHKLLLAECGRRARRSVDVQICTVRRPSCRAPWPGTAVDRIGCRARSGHSRNVGCCAFDRDTCCTPPDGIRVSRL
jgi:hypothetical protein